MMTEAVAAPRSDAAPPAERRPAAVAAAGYRRPNPRLALGILIALLAAVFLLSVSVGAVKIYPAQTVAILLGKIGWTRPGVSFDSGQAVVLWAIRLPRALAAILFGAGLAAAGASVQGVFRNPLADPGLVGVSSGAALGAVFSIALGARLGWVLPLPLAASLGGLLATGAVYFMARSDDGRIPAANFLLAGVAIAALANAGVGLLTFLADDAQLRSITFWTLGSLGGASWSTVTLAAPLTLGAVALLAFQSRALNALLLGEAEAGHLGFAPETTRRIVVVLAAVLVGVAVASAGIIGFIGLVAPHLVRLWLGPDHRTLLPACALLGGTLLSVADVLCRTLAAPAEIPVGVVTALLGAPCFLWLLRRERAQLH